MYAHISMWEKSWKLCVIVVNRSSNLLWMIGQWSWWSWYLHRLVPIYLPTFIFYVFAIKLTKYKSQMKKRLLSCKSHRTYYYLAKKKGKWHFKLKCMVLKKPKANSQYWNIKNFKHQSQKEMYCPKMIKCYYL